MSRRNQPVDVFKSINTHGNNPDVCWEWTGSTGGRDGRGYFTLAGRKRLAYRVVYELIHGEIQDDTLVIRHKCDNPICCNPMHLELGTRGQNEKDKYKRDRFGMTHEMIKAIHRYRRLGMTYVSIADNVNKQFDTNITANAVGRIVRGERRRGDVSTDNENEED